MDLPIEIKEKIEILLSHHKLTELKKISDSISTRYLNQEDKSIKNELEALVYASMRMPATFSALYSVLEEIVNDYDFAIKSVLDIGSGVGSGYFVCQTLLSNASYLGIEKEQAMIDAMKDIVGAEVNIVNSNIIEASLNNADLVIANYSLNELPLNSLDDAINKLYYSANKILIIVEPGTPEGFNEIKHIRERLISLGGYVVSPCPCNKICTNEWCHFSTRISRSKLHKYLKEGDASYEDEKYSYIVVSKNKVSNEYVRVLRHPIINKGYIDISLCTKEEMVNKRITKNDNKYKQIKKVNWGSKLR